MTESPSCDEATHKKPCNGLTIWMTGLPGSGKSTLARAVESRLKEMGRKVEVLDGEAYRENTKHDRDTNIRQIRYVAKLLTRNGVVVIAAAICPYQSGRAINSKAIGRFIEVFCRRSLAVAERRNVKGLYRRSRNGEIKFFTAIDDRYEEPLGAEVIVDTDKEIVGESVEKIWQTLRRIGYV